jgi:hypothetical protein
MSPGLRLVPRVIRAGRPTAWVDASALDRCGLAELLSGDLSIVAIAQVLGVIVDVRAAMSERDDVVDDGGGLGPAFVYAAVAEACGAHQPPLAVTLPSPAALTVVRRSSWTLPRLAHGSVGQDAERPQLGVDLFDAMPELELDRRRYRLDDIGRHAVVVDLNRDPAMVLLVLQAIAAVDQRLDQWKVAELHPDLST